MIVGLAVMLIGLGLWAAGAGGSLTLPVEYAMAGIAVVVLGQGLVRDVRELRRRQKGACAFVPASVAGAQAIATGATSAPPGPVRWEVNLCMESSVGVLLLAGAFGLILVELPPTVTLPLGLMVATVGGVLMVGVQVKDWVLTVRHIPDHYDVPVLTRPGTAASRDQAAP